MSTGGAAGNLLGTEGAGFGMMMQKLQQERLSVAIGAQVLSEQVLADTKERKAFGKPINKFQNTQFKLVECLAKVEANEIMKVIVAKQLGL